VITNVVVNALKYSPSGTPVDVSFARSAPGLTSIAVADHGRGIHPEDLDTIAEEFARGRLAEEDGGTGLGLTSARDLVAQQNGALSIQSTVGVGTTVRIDLPSIAASRPSAPTQRASSDEVPGVSKVAPTGHTSG
jgi:signal transduction histidine kinase